MPVRFATMTSMRIRPWTIAFSVAVLPASAAAAGLSTGDIGVWEKQVTSVEVETQGQDRDMLFQSASDLFPKTGTGTEETVGDEFVSVIVDGAKVTFSDVPLREWFGPYVRSIAELGIISGYRDASGVPLGRFGPADQVTLEQVVKVLLYASGKSPDQCKGTLLNAGVSGWAAPFVLCAEQAQWSVFSDGTVDTKRPATRAEVIATVLQAFGKQTGNTSGDIFTDVGSSTLYAAAIEQAKKDGIVNGYTDASGNPTGVFGPDDAVKRAEFAKMVTIALQVYGAR